MTRVIEITNEADLKKAFAIREKVFVEEQKVPREEEYDEHEDPSRHYLAYSDNVPCGAARWRFTDKGIKLERFAVLQEYRNQAIGSELLKRVLADVREVSASKPVYLHAQLPAIPFYERQGFEKAGDLFMECDIAHYKMILKH